LRVLDRDVELLLIHLLQPDLHLPLLLHTLSLLKNLPHLANQLLPADPLPRLLLHGVILVHPVEPACEPSARPSFLLVDGRWAFGRGF